MDNKRLKQLAGIKESDDLAAERQALVEHIGRFIMGRNTAQHKDRIHNGYHDVELKDLGVDEETVKIELGHLAEAVSDWLRANQQ